MRWAFCFAFFVSVSYAQPLGTEIAFTTGRAWFDDANGTLFGGTISHALTPKWAVEGGGVTSNSPFQTVLDQQPRFLTRMLIHGGVAFRLGAPRAYWFVSFGPGAFRDIDEQWTAVLAAQTGAVLTLTRRAIVRAEVFGGFQRQWLVRGVKVSFGLRF